MKNRFLPLRLITAFLGLSLLLISVLSMAGQPGNPDLRKSEGSWWERIRANQHTGVVNPTDVANAQKQAEAMRLKSASGAMGLNWLPMGPDNFSGLVWSTIFDNTDASGLTLVAGSSNGGVWKSTNLGLTWDHMPAVNNVNIKVSSLVQASDGTIFAASGVTTCKTINYTGNGIYKAVTGGEFTLIPGTESNPDFKGVAKLAINSQTGRLFAATIGGIYYSDNGNDWVKAISGYAMDVAVGSDGTVIMAVGDSAYVAPSGDLNARFNITNGHTDGLPNNGIGWMVFAIAPSDANVLYASIAGTNGKLLNVYCSTDKGLTWRIVFPNNTSFEPFGTYYGCYSNTLAVFPNDPYKLYLGGVNMWYGERIQSTGYYNWEQISFGSFGILSPFFAPQYHHSYMFRPNNENQFVISSDGGVTVGTIGADAVTFQTNNKNLQSSQFNSLAISAQKTFAMGGGDRIGTLVQGYFAPSQVSFSSNGYQIYRRDATSLGSNSQPQPSNYCGTGGTCVWSSIDPRVAVYTKYKADSTSDAPFKAFRRQDFSDINKYNDFYGWKVTGDIIVDTVSSAHIPMCLWESFNQGAVFGITRDSVKYFAEQKAVPADTTILVPSGSNRVPFSYHTLSPIPKGDSITIADPYASRYFIYGKYKTTRGIFLTLNMLKFDRPVHYFMIFKDLLDNDPVTAIEVSADLNTMWAGTSKGRLIRITGIVNAYDSATANVTSSQCVLMDTVFTNTPFAGRIVTSIAFNPSNSNQVLVTLGNYGNQHYVYYSQNGNDASPLFTSVQSDLPKVPVFSGLLEMTASGNAIVGTDLGAYSTTNINSGSPVWSSDYQNIGDVPVTCVRQQVLNDYHILNRGVVYISTYGRGIWMDTTYYSPVGIEPVHGEVAMNGVLKMNPNPVKDIVYVTYTNENPGNLVLSVYDLTGRMLLNTNLGNQPKGNVETSINLSGLSSGTYIVKVGNGFGKIVKL